MLTLNRSTKAVAKRTSLFTLVMAGIILAPIAFSSGASAREGGNGGGGGGGGAGGDNGGGSLNYGNVPDVAIAAVRPGNQRAGRAHGTVTKAGACIGEKKTCGIL